MGLFKQEKYCMENCFKGWRLAVLLLVITIIVRLPSIFVDFYNPDETYYATIGQRLLEGGMLYSTIVDHKPPIIYYLYSIFALIGGQNAIIVAHLAMILFISSTAVTIASIVRNLGKNIEVALLASTLYAIGSALGKPNDVAAANSELIFNLPISLSILFVIKSLCAEDKRKYLYACISGLAAAIAILIKQHTAVVPVMTLIYFLFAYRKRAANVASIFSYLASTLFPILVLALLFYHFERLHDAWYWTVTVNSLYVQGHEQGLHMLMRGIKQTAYMLFLEESVMWLPVIFWLALRKTMGKLFENNGGLIYLWLLFSAIAVFPGGRFFGHYYLQMLPAICILGAAASFKLLEKYAHHKKILKIAWFILIFTPLIYSWVWALPIKSFRSKLEIEEFSKVIDYLKNNTQPNEKIEVWGKFNGIPYLAGRKNGARFLSKHFLAGNFRGKELVKMPDTHWAMYMDDLEKNRPEWFVDISNTNMPNAPIEAFSNLSSYVIENYILKTNIDGYRIYYRKKF